MNNIRKTGFVIVSYEAMQGIWVTGEKEIYALQPDADSRYEHVGLTKFLGQTRLVQYDENRKVWGMVSQPQVLLNEVRRHARVCFRVQRENIWAADMNLQQDIVNICQQYIRNALFLLRVYREFAGYFEWRF